MSAAMALQPASQNRCERCSPWTKRSSGRSWGTTTSKKRGAGRTPRSSRNIAVRRPFAVRWGRSDLRGCEPRSARQCRWRRDGLGTTEGDSPCRLSRQQQGKNCCPASTAGTTQNLQRRGSRPGGSTSGWPDGTSATRSRGDCDRTRRDQEHSLIRLSPTKRCLV